MDIHNQPTYHSTATTIHWICDTFSPVFQAIDHLAAAIDDLSASIMAAFPRTTNVLDPPKHWKPNWAVKQQPTQLQSHHLLSKMHPFLYPPSQPTTQTPSHQPPRQPQPPKCLPQIPGPQLLQALKPTTSPHSIQT